MTRDRDAAPAKLSADGERRRGEILRLAERRLGRRVVLRRVVSGGGAVVLVAGAALGWALAGRSAPRSAPAPGVRPVVVASSATDVPAKVPSEPARPAVVVRTIDDDELLWVLREARVGGAGAAGGGVGIVRVQGRAVVLATGPDGSVRMLN